MQAEPPALFRVSVEGGGCSGFQYRFDLVPDQAPDDILIERDGARVVVDPVSLGFVHGAELDFVDDLIGAAVQDQQSERHRRVRLRHQLLDLAFTCLCPRKRKSESTRADRSGLLLIP